MTTPDDLTTPTGSMSGDALGSAPDNALTSTEATGAGGRRETVGAMPLVPLAPVTQGGAGGRQGELSLDPAVVVTIVRRLEQRAQEVAVREVTPVEDRVLGTNPTGQTLGTDVRLAHEHVLTGMLRTVRGLSRFSRGLEEMKRSMEGADEESAAGNRLFGSGSDAIGRPLYDHQHWLYRQDELLSDHGQGDSGPSTLGRVPAELPGPGADSVEPSEPPTSAADLRDAGPPPPEIEDALESEREAEREAEQSEAGRGGVSAGPGAGGTGPGAGDTGPGAGDTGPGEGSTGPVTDSPSGDSTQPGQHTPPGQHTSPSTPEATGSGAPNPYQGGTR